MSVRFQADADFNHTIVAAILRRFPEVDFRAARQAGLEGLKDPEVLALSARDGRILVTHDHKTMPRHFREFVRQTRSPGVIVASQALAVGRVIDDLALIWGASEPEEWINRLVFLPL